MIFENGVKNIQAAAYNSVSTVYICILKIAYRYIVRTTQISGYKSTVQCTKTELLGHFYFSDLEETPFLDQLGAILFGF